jgi:predicted nucleic acid-binding protein
MLASRLSHRVMRDFIKQLNASYWGIENLTPADLERTGQILSQYRDTELDFTDATIVAMAERLDIDTILTLDRRDFHMVRPEHTRHFNLLPQLEHS